jgi:hypothetical protein
MPEDLSEGHQEGLGSNLDVNHHATRRLLKQDASSSSSSEAGSGGPHAEHGPSMSHHDLIVKKGDPDLDTFQRMVRRLLCVMISALVILFLALQDLTRQSLPALALICTQML